METNSQPCDVHLPLQSIDNIQMLALSPTSSPVKKKQNIIEYEVQDYNSSIYIYYLFDTINFGPKSFCINQSSFSLHSEKYNTMATLGIKIKEANLLFLTKQGYI